MSLPDRKLIVLARNNNKYAEFALFEKYRKRADSLAIYYADLYNGLGITLDDFKTVAFTSVYHAYLKYDINSEIDFYVFWRITIRHDMAEFVRDAKSLFADSHVVSYAYDCNIFDCDEHQLISTTLKHDLDDLDKIAIIKEVILGSNNILKQPEKEIAKLYFIYGYTTAEIAKRYNTSESSIRKKISIARQKIINEIKSVI